MKKNNLKYFILMTSLFISACSNDTKTTQNYKLIRKDLDLGEYVQVLDENTIVTPSRIAPVIGLVTINLNTEEITVLDKTAGEARDVFVSDGFIAYRVENDIRLLKDGILTLPIKAARLRSFAWFGDWGRISYDTVDAENKWLTFKADGSRIDSGTLKGSGRFSLVDADQEYIFQQSSSGLILTTFNSPHKSNSADQVIMPGQSQGSYVTARIINGTFYVAFLDEKLGILRIGSRSANTNTFFIVDVDGAENKTYRGMDIAIFDDHGKAGLIYLDAWALRPRIARLQNKVWRSEELPFRGATGFYTKILSENINSAKIVFHNFRSTFDGIEQSFEDLALAKINK